ncbi:MAG TPA: site-specific integrase [Pseudolabrys sp.]|nr:site-specific integrase [Pseudolabrys sp.]
MLGKITKAAVERLGLNEMLWDQSLNGFGARRQRKHVHYLLRYRLNGRQRFHSIGKHGMWTPDTARTEARRLLGLVAQKVDPATERVRPAETFIGEVERYLDRKRIALKPRSFVEVERHLRVNAKPLHNLRLAEINRRTIAMTLADVEQASGPITRNRVRSSISAMFAWAIREGLTELNPVSGTGKADQGPSRDRVLTQAELATLLKVLGDDPFSEIVRLLVLTGQRRQEIGGLRWTEVDLRQGLICLPPARTKNSRLHELPISNQVRAILERQPKNGEWVFGREWSSWSHSKLALDAKLNGMADWHLHDLRRSAATHMGELGVLPHVIETILNHVSGHRAGVAGVYQRSKYQDQVKAALQLYGDWIDRLTEG